MMNHPLRRYPSLPAMLGGSRGQEPEAVVVHPAAEAAPTNIPPLLDSTAPPTLAAALDEEELAVLYALLDGHKDEARREALKKLPTLPSGKASNIAAAILRRLPTETDKWARAWMVSGLGVMNVPGTIGAVATRLDTSQEKFEWVRFWAAIALAKMQPANLKEWLEYASHDHDSLVKAVALRLLIENGADEYIDPLFEMATSPRWEDRWAACKALRSQSGDRPFREDIEARFTPILENRLSDKLELVDVRFQAAMGAWRSEA